MYKKRLNWDFLKKINDFLLFFYIDVNSYERIKIFRLQK